MEIAGVLLMPTEEVAEAARQEMRQRIQRLLTPNQTSVETTDLPPVELAVRIVDELNTWVSGDSALSAYLRRKGSIAITLSLSSSHHILGDGLPYWLTNEGVVEWDKDLLSDIPLNSETLQRSWDQNIRRGPLDLGSRDAITRLARLDMLQNAQNLLAQLNRPGTN